MIIITNIIIIINKLLNVYNVAQNIYTMFVCLHLFDDDNDDPDRIIIMHA